MQVEHTPYYDSTPNDSTDKIAVFRFLFSTFIPVAVVINQAVFTTNKTCYNVFSINMIFKIEY